jgi:hypothetical protein
MGVVTDLNIWFSGCLVPAEFMLHNYSSTNLVRYVPPVTPKRISSRIQYVAYSGSSGFKLFLPAYLPPSSASPATEISSRGLLYPVLPGERTNMASTNRQYAQVYKLFLTDISTVKGVVPISLTGDLMMPIVQTSRFP